jgi:hypothetical protein
MKTTIDIHDVLLERAKRHAKDTGQTLRALVEDGLREVLSRPKPDKPYKLEDHRYGDPNGPNPLENYTWAELRDLIYEVPSYYFREEDL